MDDLRKIMQEMNSDEFRNRLQRDTEQIKDAVIKAEPILKEQSEAILKATEFDYSNINEQDLTVTGLIRKRQELIKSMGFSNINKQVFTATGLIRKRQDLIRNLDFSNINEQVFTVTELIRKRQELIKSMGFSNINEQALTATGLIRKRQDLIRNLDFSNINEQVFTATGQIRKSQELIKSMGFSNINEQVFTATLGIIGNRHLKANKKLRDFISSSEKIFENSVAIETADSQLSAPLTNERYGEIDKTIEILNQENYKINNKYHPLDNIDLLNNKTNIEAVTKAVIDENKDSIEESEVVNTSQVVKEVTGIINSVEFKEIISIIKKQSNNIEQLQKQNEKLSIQLEAIQKKISKDSRSIWSKFTIFWLLNNILSCFVWQSVEAVQHQIFENPISTPIKNELVLEYKNAIVTEDSTQVYFLPKNANGVSVGSLSKGDLIKVIEESPDKEWIKIDFELKENPEKTLVLSGWIDKTTIKFI